MIAMGMPPIPRAPGQSNSEYRAALRRQWERHYGHLPRRRPGESEAAFDARVLAELDRQIRDMWVGVGFSLALGLAVLLAVWLGFS